MIKAVDFFCGAGGLTRGLLDAGITVLAGVDVDVRLRETYEANNAPSRFLDRDINDINITELRRDLGITGTDRVLYAACTPCQPFSSLNRRQGVDERKELLIAFAEIVRQAPPDFIIVENVPGLNTAYGRDIHDRFRAVLTECGFNDVYADLLNARDYGVPQVRKRFILLASRLGPIHAPQRAEHEPTVREFIERFPAIADGGSVPHVLNHAARGLMPHHRAIVRAVPRDGGSRRDIADTSLLLQCHRDNPTVHKDVFGRMNWDGPAPTLTCRCTDVYCGRFVHPEQDRGLSLREAAAIQTFRDDYEFHGTFFHIAHQIGNAVPVNLAMRLGRAVVRSAPED